MRFFGFFSFLPNLKTGGLRDFAFNYITLTGFSFYYVFKRFSTSKWPKNVSFFQLFSYRDFIYFKATYLLVQIKLAKKKQRQQENI